MLQLQSRLLVLACAMSAASVPSHAAGSATFSAGLVHDTRVASIDCKKVFVPADVAGIVTAPATVSSDTLLGPGGCKFETAQGAIVTTFVSGDEDAKITWNDASATSDRKYYTPMSGVGDAALWREAGSSAWLLVKKGDTVCKVELGIPGGAEEGTARARGMMLAKKMGALCTKALAAT